MTERGAGSVLILAVAALALMLAATIGMVGSLLRARTEVAAAADAAALAAAPVTFRPFGAAGTAAEEARRFAGANHTMLVRCDCRPDTSWSARTVEVEVKRVVRFGPLGSIPVRAVSRAEFVPVLLLGPRSRSSPSVVDDRANQFRDVTQVPRRREAAHLAARQHRTWWRPSGRHQGLRVDVCLQA